MFHRVDSRRDDAQHNLALRHDGINHDRAEDTVVLAQVDNDVRALVHIAREEDRRDGAFGDTRVEALGLQRLLQMGREFPQLLTVLGMLVDNLQTALDTPNDRHRQALGVDLRAHIEAQIGDDILIVAADKAADDGHSLGESAEIEVNVVGAVEVGVRTATLGTHNAHTVGIVDKDAEVELLLQSNNLVQRTEVAFHTVDTFGSHQYAAALLLGQSSGLSQLLAQALDVVVLIFETLGTRHAETVDQAGVSLAVIDDDIAQADNGIKDTDLTLIAEVEQVAVFFVRVLAQHSLNLLVQSRVTRHHTGTHRISQTPAACTFLVGGAHLRIVGQTQVVVKAPVQDLLAVERHLGTQLAFELREIKIAIGQLAILSQRTAGRFFDSFKNIFHIF